ncbi:petrobactin biosynthesis protein AsbD [Alkalihalophilus lindianensis]|uniref:Petrobactin biosynthesis protein AsbD n=1 Tax=Alkalihalophilus lindianensis TaxID=1630542 RepID=A0ABU3XF82_9BACI|nr:petrobactin biosynthesis protein AsbD [Alkalihalophilus lindianensis]MDV2686554.1 petrobactin biosynthesis protein AsbD [Alkalihalophilus lindianensis]
MTQEEAVKTLYTIMQKDLNLPTLASFNEDARLNEDLCMDSIMILQLILHLEVDYGIEISDEQLSPNNFYKVSNLATYICEQSNTHLSVGEFGD